MRVRVCVHARTRVFLSLCSLSMPVILSLSFRSLSLSFGVSRISDSTEILEVELMCGVFPFCFSSSSRSDTKWSTGSEPRAVSWSSAFANHSHWNDGSCEVRETLSGQSLPKKWEGHHHVSHRVTWDGEAQPLNSEDHKPGLGVRKVKVIPRDPSPRASFTFWAQIILVPLQIRR